MRIQGDVFNSSVDFGVNVNNPLDTGWAFANAALGVFNQYTEASANPRLHAQRTAIESFVQDNWKVHRRLTLDIGLRLYWTPRSWIATTSCPASSPRASTRRNSRCSFSPRSTRRSGASAWIRATARLTPPQRSARWPQAPGDLYNGMVSTLLDPSYPRGLAERPGHEFGPRLGFAYDVTGKAKTVIRGGFGMFYNREVMANAFKWLIAQPPNAVTPILQYGQLSQLHSYSGLFFPNDVSAATPRGHSPEVMNYSFSIQRNIGRDTLVDVGYTGALGRHLWWRRNINPVPIGADFLARNADPTQPGKPLRPRSSAP